MRVGGWGDLGVEEQRPAGAPAGGRAGRLQLVEALVGVVGDRAARLVRQGVDEPDRLARIGEPAQVAHRHDDVLAVDVDVDRLVGREAEWSAVGHG